MYTFATLLNNLRTPFTMKFALLAIILLSIAGCTQTTIPAPTPVPNPEPVIIPEPTPPIVEPSQTPPQPIPQPAPQPSTQPPVAQPEKTTISRLELSVHNNMQDCWIAYNGKVYNMTSWLPRHPGNAQRILPHCGTYEEFTAAFEKQHGKTKVAFLMTVAEIMGDFEVVGNIK